MERSKKKEAEIPASAPPTPNKSGFPGFRFCPTDQELIQFYLRRKVEGSLDKSVEIITEIDICKHEPWDLPAKSIIESDTEWFFFSPRVKKYLNGSQSRRATETGYWKATGKERDVKSGLEVIGTKRTLVFHVGRAPKGTRTEWIMHEYCMPNIGRTSSSSSLQDSLVVCRLRKKNESNLTNSSTTTDEGSNGTSTPRYANSDHDVGGGSSNPSSLDRFVDSDVPGCRGGFGSELQPGYENEIEGSVWKIGSGSSVSSTSPSYGSHSISHNGSAGGSDSIDVPESSHVGRQQQLVQLLKI